MPKFRLIVTEKVTGFVDIEATNVGEAVEGAQEAYNEGQVTWTNYEITNISTENISSPNQQEASVVSESYLHKNKHNKQQLSRELCIYPRRV